MRLIICALFLMFGHPVWAKSVTVTSGEHDGFTRIVLDFGTAVDWTLGRTTDGYALRVKGGVPKYDLAGLYDLIGKNRLAAMWASPDTGMLNIGFACACHAIPFEFRPGIVVIDLRDGAPPKGSSFEDSIDVLQNLTVSDLKTPGPQYDWVSARALNGSVVPEKPQGATQHFGIKPTSDPILQPLKNQLLRQLSRGAADGVIELGLPNIRAPDIKTPNYSQARVALGEMPGVSIARQASADLPLGEQGDVCTSAADLDVQSWGDDTPVSQQIGPATANVLGEFDHPDMAAVERAVHFMLFAGFGIEAALFVDAFAPDHPKEELWRSIGEIVDGTSGASDFFVQQASCDTPAALWSFLADRDPRKRQNINVDAVILAFSNLPQHLRRNLGPKLAENFLQMRDVASAMTVQNAMTRASIDVSPAVALSQAKIAIAHGDIPAAEEKIDALSTIPGPSRVPALIELVETRVAQVRPIEAKVAQELAAVNAEMQGSPDGQAINRALVLAQASSGAATSALSGSEGSETLKAQVWKVLAQLGSDADILVHGVLEQKNVPTGIEMGAVQKIIGRLVDIGLPDAAAVWAAAYDIADTSSIKAAPLIESTGADVETEKVLDMFSNDATNLALESENLGLPPKTGGVLEQGHNLAEISAQTRSRVVELLAQVPALTAPQ